MSKPKNFTHKSTDVVREVEKHTTVMKADFAVHLIGVAIKATTKTTQPKDTTPTNMLLKSKPAKKKLVSKSLLSTGPIFKP